VSLEALRKGDLTVRDSFLMLASIICDRESVVRKPEPTRVTTYEWESDSDIFPEPLQLTQITMDINPPTECKQVFQATFKLPDEEMDINVIQGIRDLEGDPFAEDILEKFVSRYERHSHELCLEALARKATAEQKQQLRQHQRTSAPPGEIEVAGQPLKVIDKRSSARLA
jgi:hypothetical protein